MEKTSKFWPSLGRRKAWSMKPHITYNRPFLVYSGCSSSEPPPTSKWPSLQRELGHPYIEPLVPFPIHLELNEN